MIAADLWIPRSKRLKRPYQPRYNRDCYGELVQIDGSHHDWFEGRAAKCCLLVFIDDATGKLQHLRFCESESAFDYEPYRVCRRVNILRDYSDEKTKLYPRN